MKMSWDLYALYLTCFCPTDMWFLYRLAGIRYTVLSERKVEEQYIDRSLSNTIVK